MSAVELVADTSVISYLFNECSLGRAYEDLIGSRSVGITGQSIAELRAGVVMAKWGERRMAEHSHFLGRFTHVPDTRAMAEACGVIRAIRFRIGEPIEAADAWPAACAMWLDVPLVTHDTDHEGIAGLRVLTLHDEWEVRATLEAPPSASQPPTMRSRRSCSTPAINWRAAPLPKLYHPLYRL